MKQLLMLILLVVPGALGCAAQTTYTTNANGELVQVATIKTEAEVIGNAQPTGQKFKATNGETYDVYQSSKGRLFIVRESKTGNHYKQYLEEKQ